MWNAAHIRAHCITLKIPLTHIIVILFSKEEIEEEEVLNCGKILIYMSECTTGRYEGMTVVREVFAINSERWKFDKLEGNSSEGLKALFFFALFC